jgi:hypothetical protein
MNIIEPIVLGYTFNEITDIMDDKKKVMSGGLPITHLVKSMEFISQTGGGAVRETPVLTQLEKFSIPIGLVYVPSLSSNLKYENQNQERVNGVIPDDIYDKLVDLVSYHRASNGTRKNRSSTHDRKTKRSH